MQRERIAIVNKKPDFEAGIRVGQINLIPRTDGHADLDPRIRRIAAYHGVSGGS